MTESHIYYAKIAHELTYDRARAQEYLIQGCKQVNRKLIEIALTFGADLKQLDSSGISPIEILAREERARNKKT